MHHKRRRPKSRRAGCLLCKPWKANGAKGRASARRIQQVRADASRQAQRDDLLA